MDKPYPPQGMDWLWYRPDPEPTDEYNFLDATEGWYHQAYMHKQCQVGWHERVSDMWVGQPRCFNCGRWVKRRA